MSKNVDTTAGIFDPRFAGTTQEETMYALVTTQGTAMAETALCPGCLPKFAQQAIASAGNDRADDYFREIHGNDALACIACGWSE